MKIKLNLLLAMATLAVAFQSCTKEEVIPIDVQSKSTEGVSVRKIQQSDLPQGVKPKVINSEAELDAVIIKLQNLELKTAPPKLGVKTRSESGPGSHNIIVNLSHTQSYYITIYFSWKIKGYDLNTSSAMANKWEYSFWRQTGGGGYWRSRDTVEFIVYGDIVEYYIVNGDIIEVTKIHMSTSGNVRV